MVYFGPSNARENISEIVFKGNFLARHVRILVTYLWQDPRPSHRCIDQSSLKNGPKYAQFGICVKIVLQELSHKLP